MHVLDRGISISILKTLRSKAELQEGALHKSVLHKHTTYIIHYKNPQLRPPVTSSPADRLCKFAARHWDAPRGRGTGSGQTAPHPGCPRRPGERGAVDGAGRAGQAWARGDEEPRGRAAVRQLRGFGRSNRAGCVVTERFHWLSESEGRRCCRWAEFTRRRYWKIKYGSYFQAEAAT